MWRNLGCTLVVGIAVLAFASKAEAQVCVRVDEAQDTLSPQERRSAAFLLARQFDSVGKAIVQDCPAPYTVSHVRLGTIMIVTLSGPEGQREGKATGLEDLPALYNQLVRALVAPRPEIVDRARVAPAQTSTRRVSSYTHFYVRLGYGSTFSGGAHATPAFGLGFRRELEVWAADISFLNIQGGRARSATIGGGSLVKVAGMRFLRPTAGRTPYLGGGLSWGGTTIDGIFNGTIPSTRTSGWEGQGLRGELSVGYELARATTIRLFLQGDVILPFYQVTRKTYSGYSGLNVVGTEKRYAPSVALSVGLGWQKRKR
jgi:hypothetical protein